MKGLAWALLATCGMLSCRPGARLSAVGSNPQLGPVVSAGPFLPRQKTIRSDLIFWTVNIPVSSDISRQGNTIHFSWKLSDGTTVATETYQSRNGGINYVGSDAETWTPALPIFPPKLKANAIWTWKGIYQAGKRSTKGWAEFEATEASQDRVVINARIMTGPSSAPTVRKGKFVLVRGEFVVERTIDQAAKRVPPKGDPPGG